MQEQDIPAGFCQCGCGRPAPIASATNRQRGNIKGEPMRYCKGHNTRRRGVTNDYLEEDRGYATPCWIWQLTGSEGYGTTKVNGVSRAAHRVYYERDVGPIPDGLEIDHLCRVRRCCNPEHLEPVTHAENVRRGVRDSSTWGRPVTELSRQIIAVLPDGRSQREIARAFGVSQSYVNMIARGLRGPNSRRKP